VADNQSLRVWREMGEPLAEVATCYCYVLVSEHLEPFFIADVRYLQYLVKLTYKHFEWITHENDLFGRSESLAAVDYRVLGRGQPDAVTIAGVPHAKLA